MAIQNLPAPPAAPNEQRVNEEWEEEHYKNALAHFEKLQDQLDELRTVLPQIVRSVAIPHATPTALHSAFKTAAWGGSRSIDVMKTAWDGEETQTLFAKARKSLAENPDLDWSLAREVPKYGWIEAVRREKEEKQGKEVKIDNVDEQERPLTLEEMRKMVGEFRDRYQGFQIAWDEEVREIKISFKVPTLNRLRFVVNRLDTDRGISKYKAECTGNMKVLQAITRCLAMRPKQHDLKYILDMIAAYADTRKAECAKCDKTIDGKGMTVAARRERKVRKGDDVEETEWIALHESCL